MTDPNYSPTWDDITTELDDLRAQLVTLVGNWLPVLETRGDHSHLAGMVAAYRLVIHTLTARMASIRNAVETGDPVPRFGCEEGPRQMGLFDDLDLQTWCAARFGEREQNIRTAAQRLALATSDRRPRKVWK